MGRVTCGGRWRALVVALVVTCGLPGIASAAPVAWSLVASPLATSTGMPTTFSLTATNLLLGQIRCLYVDVPGNFIVSGAAITSSPDDDSWRASVTSNRVQVWTNSGGDELDTLKFVTFSIDATATSAGQSSWDASSFENQSCTESRALLSVPPVVVVTGPALTPTPVPTATPRPTATSTPRPTPTPVVALPSLPPPLPSLLPSLLPSASPSPTASSAAAERPPATPGPTPTPQPRATQTESPMDGSGPGAAPRAREGGTERVPAAQVDAGSVAVVLEPTDGGGIDIATADLLVGLGLYAVPAAALALPGVLILVWLALQTVGAMAWIPAVLRLRGRDDGSPDR